MMILNCLFPVFALVILGNLLKRYHLTNEIFLKTSDKLVYFILFPVLLFWKIGGASSETDIDWHFCMAAICAVMTIYVLSCIAINRFDISDYQAGTFSQSCYRFNTYIGVAVILNALGEDGIRHFGIVIGFIIPIINVMAVSTLIWFSGREFTTQERIRFTVKAILSNPLILACVAGIIYSGTVRSFPVFLENTFSLISMATLPLALFSIGSGLTFANLKGYLKVSLIGAVFKLMLLPLIGYFFFKIFHVTGIPFKVGMIFFSLPASTALYILSSQLNSDTELASASVMLSTLLSFFSLSVALIL